MKTVNEIKAEIEELQKQLIEAETRKWKPKKSKYAVTSTASVLHSEYLYADYVDGLATIGNSFETVEIAEAYAKQLKNLFLINAWIREENKRTGWVADWKDLSQLKYVVEFDVQNKRFGELGLGLYRSFGQECTSKESAVKLKYLLNNGMIEGIEL